MIQSPTESRFGSVNYPKSSPAAPASDQFRSLLSSVMYAGTQPGVMPSAKVKTQRSRHRKEWLTECPSDDSESLDAILADVEKRLIAIARIERQLLGI